MAENKSTQDKDAQQRAKAQPETAGSGSKIQGEGDYEAGRHYDEKTREYVKSHDVEQAARAAAPANAAEARTMEQAEEKGRERAKEEDRLLNKDKTKSGARDPSKR